MLGAHTFSLGSNHARDGEIILQPITEMFDDENNQRVTLKRFSWICTSYPGVTGRKFGGPECVNTSMWWFIWLFSSVCFTKLMVDGEQRGNDGISGYA